MSESVPVDPGVLAVGLLAELASRGATVRKLAVDSRAVAAETAFLAYPGAQTDGRRFIPQAVQRGASAVLWERAGFAWDAALSLPNLPVDNLRALAGHLAHVVYGRPSEQLDVLGVTGTNGKTTITQWLAQALPACTVIGTIGSGFPGALQAMSHTTPEAVSVHRLLRQHVELGARAVAMEVSSHALSLARVNGVRFRLAVFSNLSRDHLDFHGDMQAYAAAKARLFHMPGLHGAVLNLDDPVGLTLAGECAGRLESIGYRIVEDQPVATPPAGVATVEAKDLRLGADGSRFDLCWNGARRAVTLPALGRYNVANALAVGGSLLALGQDLDAVADTLEKLRNVPGRLERLGGGALPLVVIDYAHTPDALAKALAALRPLLATRGSLVCVFGCGGERDPGKRPLMGEVAGRLADRVVVTSDNPRGEPPLAIIEQIRRGLPGKHAVEVERAAAIALALREARAGDVVLIAGKGHEAYQEIGGSRLPFSDSAVVRELLAGLADAR